MGDVNSHPPAVTEETVSNNTTTHVSRRTISGLTATGLTQANACPLSNEANHEFTTVSLNTGAVLPAAKQPSSISVWDDGISIFQVYPPVGSTVNRGSVNTAYMLCAASGITFFASDIRTWYANSSAGSSGTVTSVATGVGLTGGPITGTGIIALGTIAEDFQTTSTSVGNSWSMTSCTIEAFS
jgi:hypothetical protein